MIIPHEGFLVYCKNEDGEFERIGKFEDSIEDENHVSLKYELFSGFEPMTLNMRIMITEDQKAKLIGFKNAACLSRAIRRRKRKIEKQRRERLKNTKFYANECDKREKGVDNYTCRDSRIL